MCYTYDSLSRVTSRTVKKLSDDSIVSTETFSYDAAGNITDAPDSCFQYDTNNRLISFNGNAVSYDLDGNMLSNGSLSCTYDSGNRLVSAGGHTYTYNAEDVRIRNLCSDEDTTYTYDTNCKLSKLLTKTTNNVVTKYVYGRGLIGEETGNSFKTYHFDARGSTVAITDLNGTISDTFAYDTYGRQIARTGTSNVIFGYNGRDGVVTDDNGLIYMRARYYSHEVRRFVNADVVPGKISNAITLNRFAYANGNPVSFIDPFGLSACPWGPCRVCLREEGYRNHLAGDISEPNENPRNNNKSKNDEHIDLTDEGLDYAQNPKRAKNNGSNSSTEAKNTLSDLEKNAIKAKEAATENTLITITGKGVDFVITGTEYFYKYSIMNSPRPNNIGRGVYLKMQNSQIAQAAKELDFIGYSSSAAFTLFSTYLNYQENVYSGESKEEIISDIVISLGAEALSTFTSIKIGAAVGTALSPGVGTALGIFAGLLIDGIGYLLDEYVFY